MRIFILTLGTRGDFELFLMLGRELGSRGHRVVLGTSEFYSGTVKSAGLEWAQIGNGTRGELISILRSLCSVRDKTERTYLYYTKWLQPQLSMAIDQITSIAAGTDYFINNLKMVLQRGPGILPGASVTYDPPGKIEDLAKYAGQLVKHTGRILEIVAMNKELIDPEDLWGEQYRFTGFWKDEQRSDWRPPADLIAFLDNGRPPVVITMGSMVMFENDRFIRNVIQALRMSEQRGIVVGGWSGVYDVRESAGLAYCVNEIPYDWLFKRVSCVIHHGGVGTVGAVLRAGQPSILVPQVTCQEHFGKILARENLVTGVFDVHTLNPEDLAAAIRKAVSDEQTKKSAKKWQKIVLAEKGIEATVDLIEGHWDQLNGSDLE